MKRMVNTYTLKLIHTYSFRWSSPNY